MGKLSRRLKRFKNPLGFGALSISAAYIISGVTILSTEGSTKMMGWILIGIGCAFALVGIIAFLWGLFRKEAEETPSIKESCKKATEIWLLVYTGEKHQKYLSDRNYSYKFKKILLLDFNKSKDAFKYIVERSGEEDESKLVSQIKTTTKLAIKNKAEVKWYSEKRDYTIVIYDPNATDNDKPWLVFQYFDPFQSVEDRYLSPPIKKSVDKAQYEYYFDEFMRIWNDNTTRVPNHNEYKQ